MRPDPCPPPRNCALQVKALYKQVVGEVPGSPVFAMKLAPPSRHLEVQLLW